VIPYISALILILLAILGTPLFVVILAVAMLGFHYQGVNLSVIAIEIFRIADTPVLLALPLFTFAGYLLGESRTSQRLVRLTRAFLGWMPGGLAIVAFVACAFFTAFTGASGVTIVALGALLYPALTEAGYRDKFSIGLVTSSGSLGLLLPPSLPLILYGIIAQQMDIGANVAISDLFLAGILPALLMVLMLSLYSLWENRRNPMPLNSFSAKEAVAALREAVWEIPLPVFVLGGIYGGFFAISEAAVNYAGIHGDGGGNPSYSGCGAGIDQFLNRCRSADAPVQSDSGPCHQQNCLSDFAEYFIVDTRCYSGHLFCSGHYDPHHPARGGQLRDRSGSSGHYFSGQHANRLLHAAGGDEPIYCQLPLR